MSQVIKVPDVLEDVSEALDTSRLLVAREWEKAAIVFAFTAVGGPRNTAYHEPEPPRVNIRQFARLGFSGLTTVKAVVRYRRAWSWAITEGLALPVEPGALVNLPMVAFPSWNEVMTEYVEEEEVDEAAYFQSNNALRSQLYSIHRQLRRCLSWVPQMAPVQREEVRDQLQGIYALLVQLERELGGE